MDNMMGEYISTLQKQRSLSLRDLGKLCDLSHTHIDSIIKGYDPRTGKRVRISNDTISKLAAGLGIDETFLFNLSIGKDLRSSEEFTPSKKGIRIPVLGRIPAGVPIEMVSDVEEWEDIPLDMAARGNFFGLRVVGDSMSPEYLNDDIIIVRSQPDAETGDDVVVTVNGDDATFKRINISENGVILKPINPAYDPYFFTMEDVAALPITILGVAEELRRKKSKKK